MAPERMDVRVEPNQNAGDSVGVQRPERWDYPLAESFADVDLHWLMRQAPFSQMMPEDFPRNAGVKEILRNDSRIVTFAPGDLVMREGLYSGSAFLVLDGNVRVLQEQLALAQSEQTNTKKKSYWESLKQFWKTHKVPEQRQIASASADSDLPVGLRTDGETPRVFIQDINVVLNGCRSEPLGAGELFGELAAITRAPSNYTVVAETECQVLEIRWQGLRLLRRSQVFREYLDGLYRNNSLNNQLSDIPAFQFVPPEQITKLAEVSELVSLGELEWYDNFKAQRQLDVQSQILKEPIIAEEAHPADSIFVIRSGFARESVRQGAGHRTLAYLGKGQVFGLVEAATNLGRRGSQPPLPYQSSLRAVGFVDLIRIPKLAVYEELLPYVRADELSNLVDSVRYDARGVAISNDRSKLTENPPSASKPNDSKSSHNNHSTSLLEYLVDQRLMNGQEAMVIDTMRCTRCDDCVTACAAMHEGNPRFQRQGPKFDRWMFAQSCMHCVDPVCMLGCPTGAIHRNRETGVVAVNPQTCIGCSTCSNSCPYDNIVMVEIRDPSGRRIVDEEKGLPILQATKCDLCQTQPNGPACVSACPHDALIRVNLSDPNELSQISERRA